MKKTGRQIFAGLMALGIAAAAPMAAQAFTFTPPPPVSAGTVNVDVAGGSAPDVADTPVAADTAGTETTPAAAGLTATITPTGIRADSVFNTKGYANLVQDAVMSNPNLEPLDVNNSIVTSRQVALIDRNGNVILPYRKSYNNFYCYSDGIISLTGQTSYMAMDEEIGIMEEDYGIDNYYYYDPAGNELFRVDSENFCGPICDGYAILIEQSRVYIINGRGEKVKELAGSYASPLDMGDVAGNAYYEWEVGLFENGLARVMDWSGYEGRVLGYINPNGDMAIDLSSFGYVNSGNFEADLTWAGNGGDLGFIDKAGNLVIPYQYESAYPFTADGVAGVKKDGKWGFIDQANNTVIPFMYDNTFGGMYNGLAAVGQNGKYGYVDRNNQVIVPLEYDDISTFENGVGYAIKDGFVYIITL